MSPIVKLLPTRQVRRDLDQGGGEMVDRVADRVEHSEQGESLDAHRLLHNRIVAQLWDAERGDDARGEAG